MGVNQRQQKDIDEAVVKGIVEALKTLKFGSLQIVVHNSRVVQIERVEKIRVESGCLVYEGESI